MKLDRRFVGRDPQIDVAVIDQRIPRTIGAEELTHRAAGPQRQGTGRRHLLAQVYEAGVVTDVSVGQEDAMQVLLQRHGFAADLGQRLPRRRQQLADLLVEVGRRVDQVALPRGVVDQSEAGNARILGLPGTHPGTNMPEAVDRGNAAVLRRAEHDDLHTALRRGAPRSGTYPEPGHRQRGQFQEAAAMQARNEHARYSTWTR